MKSKIRKAKPSWWGHNVHQDGTEIIGLDPPEGMVFDETTTKYHSPKLVVIGLKKQEVAQDER